MDNRQLVLKTVNSTGPADGIFRSSAHDGHVAEVNNDDFPDIVTYFKIRDTGIAGGDTEGELTGEANTDSFEGTDLVTAMGCN